MAIPIKRGMEKVPGGLMLVPLVVGAVINTAAPDTGTFFGSFTGALFTGLTALLAVFYVCLGATLDVRTAPYIARKGGVLLVSKIAFAVVVGVIAGHVLGQGPVSGGVFGGLSALALVAAFSDTNGGLYMSLMGQFGRNRDVGAYSLMSLESGPFLTMVILGVAGLSAFPWQTLLGAILPLLLGMLLGNLDPEMRKFLAPLVPAMVPFLGLSLGFTLNLGDVWSAGLLGLALGVVVVLAGGAWMLFVDRVTKGNGVAGLAAASTAGNAAVVPAIVAEANDHYDSSAASATVLVAASVVVTAVLCPIVTALWFKYRVAGTALDESAARDDPATVSLAHESDAADPELPREDYVTHPSGQPPGDGARKASSTLKTRRND